MNKFLIKNPLITERTTDLAALGQYAFKVDNNATKNDIKKLMKEIYKVDAVKVRVINVKPKPTATFTRFSGIKPGYKKALVTLKKGQKLDILSK